VPLAVPEPVVEGDVWSLTVPVPAIDAVLSVVALVPVPLVPLTLVVLVVVPPKFALVLADDVLSLLLYVPLVLLVVLVD
jgi:hypothetical protein